MRISSPVYFGGSNTLSLRFGYDAFSSEHDSSCEEEVEPEHEPDTLAGQNPEKSLKTGLQNLIGTVIKDRSAANVLINEILAKINRMKNPHPPKVNNGSVYDID